MSIYKFTHFTNTISYHNHNAFNKNTLSRHRIYGNLDYERLLGNSGNDSLDEQKDNDTLIGGGRGEPLASDDNHEFEEHTFVTDNSYIGSGYEKINPLDLISSTESIIGNSFGRISLHNISGDDLSLNLSGIDSEINLNITSNSVHKLFLNTHII